MNMMLRAVLAAALLLPGAYAAAQDAPQQAAERCKDIEQQGPNKMQLGERGQDRQPSSSDKLSDAGSLDAVVTRSGGAAKDDTASTGKQRPNKGMAMGPGTQDCVIYVNPNDKPQ